MGAGLVDSSQGSSLARAGGLTLVRRWLARPGAWALWLGAPIAVLLADPGWLLPAPWRDPWIYYGYFRHAGEYLQRYPSLYFSSRLSVILPGHAALSLLAEPLASLALHAAVLAAVGAAFAYVARRLCGPAAGNLATVLLLSDPFVLRAVGDGHVDGFGMLYFLVAAAALVRARERDGLIWLAVAGIGALAMVVANLFYAVQLPWLLGLWWLLRPARRAGRDDGREGLAFAAGGALCFLTLAVASMRFGGPFAFYRSSLEFATTATSWISPYRHSWSEWVPSAHWLVVPTLVLASAVRGAWRGWRAGEATAAVVQAQFLVFWVMLIGFQSRPQYSPLEYCFYASMLLAPAYLALAGQLSRWVGDWSVPRRRRLLLLAAAAALVALGRWIPAPLPGDIGESPAVLSLVLGAALLLFGALPGPGRAWRAPAAAIAAVTVAHFLARETTFLRIPDPLAAESKTRLFAQMENAVQAIERAGESGPLRLWYDKNGTYGEIFDAVGCAFLLTPNLVNTDFPSLHDGRLDDGGQLVSGQRIALVSERADAVALAQAEARTIGLSIRPGGTEPIPGLVPGFAIHVLEVGPADPSLPRPETPRTMDFPATDQRLSTIVGTRDERAGVLRSNGVSGYFQFGPYLRLTPGTYEVSWEGEVKTGVVGWAIVDVVYDSAKTTLASGQLVLAPTPPSSEIARLRFELRQEVTGVEFRFLIGPEVQVSLNAVHLRRLAP